MIWGRLADFGGYIFYQALQNMQIYTALIPNGPEVRTPSPNGLLDFLLRALLDSPPSPWVQRVEKHLGAQQGYVGSRFHLRFNRKAATGVGGTGVGAEPVFANPRIPPTPVNGPLLHSLPGKTYKPRF